MHKVLIVVITVAILGVYGVFLRDQLSAGRWWVLGIGLIISFAMVYWMSPDDRPTFHRFFNRLLRR
jgi:K+ transporter